MSGGKGGSTSSTVEIPQYIEDAAKRNLARADTISQIGYVPYYGADVAAFTPMQEAAFQNTAGTAGAFGLAGGGMSQQDVMGGMPAPTTYAGGVRGYSSAPMFEESMAELATRRPGQKALIDSLFVDPYSGVAGANVGPTVDYTATPGDLGGISAGGGGDLVSYPGVNVGNGSALSDAEIAGYSQVIADELGMDSFDPSQTAESQMTQEQYDEYQSQSMSNSAQLAADNIYMNNLGNANSNIIDAGKGLLNIEPSFDSPSSAGSYGGSLVTGGLSGNLTGIPGIAGNIADNILSSVAPEYAMELQGRNFAESGGSTYDPNMSIVNPISGKTTTGGYDFDPTAFSSDYGAREIPVGVSPATPIPTYDAFSGAASDMPDTSMTAIPGYTTPSPAPAPTTFVNDYSDPATLAKYKADRAPGGVHYESSGSQRREAEQRAAIKAKDDTLAQTVDTSELANLAKSKDTAKQWLKDNGYGNYDRNDAIDGLRGKIADINKSQLQQGLKDGIIYKDDRREVYVDGVMVGNPKSAESAKKILDRELKKKAEATPPPPPPPPPPASGTSDATGMEVRSLPNGTEYFVDSSGQFAGLK
jgi:hypothetical protein